MSFSPLQESHARSSLMEQLQVMGFLREGALRALQATQHSGAPPFQVWSGTVAGLPYTVDSGCDGHSQAWRLLQTGSWSIQRLANRLQPPHASPPQDLGPHPWTASARRRQGWRASCGVSSSWQLPLTGALFPLVSLHVLLARRVAKRTQKFSFLLIYEGEALLSYIAKFTEAVDDKCLVPLCRTLEQAFADLRGLMAKAGEMVQLAERFRQALAERAAAGQDGGEAGAEDWMDADMEAELISMGIASPVTKASAGALYHRELSRQVRGLRHAKAQAHSILLLTADVIGCPEHGNLLLW